MTNYLPKVLEFTDLHLKKGRKAAKLALKGLSGIYAIIHIPSGRVYIGSSINLARRLAEHLGYGNTNGRLQNCLAKHGLKDFVFCVVELYSVDPEVSKETNQANLLALEQKHLVWLFSLPDMFRFNFSPVAGAPIAGRTHSEDTLVILSDANKGANNPMYGKTGALNPMYGRTHTPESKAQMSANQRLVDRSEANHPMYGKVPANAMTVNVNSLDNQLVREFSSQVACAQWLGVSEGSVRNYIRSGKVFKGLYLLSNS